MSDWLQPSRSLAVHANAASEWPKWRHHFELCRKASKQTSNDSTAKVAILLTAMGPDEIDIYKLWSGAATKARMTWRELYKSSWTLHIKGRECKAKQILVLRAIQCCVPHFLASEAEHHWLERWSFMLSVAQHYLCAAKTRITYGTEGFLVCIRLLWSRRMYRLCSASLVWEE